MPRDMDDEDGIVGKGPVELGLRRKALLGEEIGIATESHHELPRADRAALRDALERRDHVGHAPAGAGRRGGAQGLRLDVNEREEMAVAVDEPGNERAAGKIDEFGLLAPVCEDRRPITHGDDLPPGHRHGFDARLGVVHREDRAAGVDPIGGRGRLDAKGRRGTCHEPADNHESPRNLIQTHHVNPPPSVPA